MRLELTDILAKHKTEQFGASYDTDYKVITTCTPDCPACAQRELVKWQQEDCTEHKHGLDFHLSRKECLLCWLELLKHFELEVK